MARPRKQTRRERLSIEAGPHRELLAELDRLANIPAAPCPACDRGYQHYRCGKCNACAENWPPAGVCPACRAKPNRFSQPLRAWSPRVPFAAEFGRDLADKIRRGVVPSDKQVALANRLATEDHVTLPTTAKRPALAMMTPTSPAWKHVLALVQRDAFCLIPWRETSSMLTERALFALLETHAWALREKWVREPTRADLAP